MPELTIFAVRMKKIRTKMGLTQAEFAAMVGISEEEVSLIDGYSCAGVPLFRRNGYRQSSGRKPLFRNRDTALN